MEKKLDLSWFDLKKYEGLKELDLYGWERQISERQNIRKFYHHLSRELAAYFFEDIKIYPIIEEKNGREQWGEWRKSDVNHPYNTNSVFSITAESLKIHSYSLGLKSPNHSLPNPFNDLSYREKTTFSEAQPDLSGHNIDRANFQFPITYTPLMRVEFPELSYDTPTIGGNRGSFLNTTAVIIDLSADDEQIKKDFDHWLYEFKKTKKRTAENDKDNVTEKMDLADWVRQKLLPYIDLMLAAEFDGFTLGHVQAAKLIFPVLSGESDNKIRRTTKPKANWLMKEETLFAIRAQLRSMSPK